MKKNICRVIKIEKEALYEFIYENFIACQEDILDVKGKEVSNTFAIDWEKDQFIFCAHKAEDKHGNRILFPEDIDINKVLKKIPASTNSVLCQKPYKDYTFDELKKYSN